MTSMNRTELEAYLPHAGDMVLLDAVDAISPDAVACRASSHALASNPLRRGGVVPANAALEYAAQAIALHGRWRTRAEPSSKQAAFIAVLRHARWRRQPLSAAPAPLIVSARLLAELGESAHYAFEVTDALGAQIAAGEAIVTFGLET